MEKKMFVSQIKSVVKALNKQRAATIFAYEFDLSAVGRKKNVAI